MCRMVADIRNVNRVLNNIRNILCLVLTQYHMVPEVGTMNSSTPLPSPIDFNVVNLADTWKKWRRNMQLYIDAVMSGKSEKEKYSMLLLAIGEGGWDIFSTWTWDKGKDKQGADMDEDYITVKALFTCFGAHCIPKKNIVLEKLNFSRRNQMSHKPFDSFLPDLRKLSTSCDFDKLNDGMLVYKLADGLENERVCEKIISKGASITLEKPIELCRADELTRCRKKELASEEYTNIEELRKVL